MFPQYCDVCFQQRHFVLVFLDEKIDDTICFAMLNKVSFSKLTSSIKLKHFDLGLKLIFNHVSKLQETQIEVRLPTRRVEPSASFGIISKSNIIMEPFALKSLEKTP